MEFKIAMPEAASITTFSFCLKKSYFFPGGGGSAVLCKISFLRALSPMVEFFVLGRDSSGAGGAFRTYFTVIENLAFA